MKTTNWIKAQSNSLRVYGIKSPEKYKAYNEYQNKKWYEVSDVEQLQKELDSLKQEIQRLVNLIDIDNRPNLACMELKKLNNNFKRK